MVQTLTTAEACEKLGVSASTLHKWVRAGTLKPTMQAPGLRGARFFNAADIDALLAERAS